MVDGVALEAEGLLGVLKWIGEQPETRELPVGLFGSGSGVVTALDAAAMNPNVVRALVCLDGRADLAADLAGVEAQTMLLVDGCDARLVALNRWALDRLRCPSRMLEIASASHLGQNAVEWATRWTSEWFVRCLALEPGWHQSAAPFAPGEQDHAGVAISS